MTDRQRALQEALTTFARRMASDYDIGDVLDLLVMQVPRVLGVDAGGVTLRDPAGGTGYAAASDTRAAATEKTESALNQGPCVGCIIDREIKVVTDLRTDGRWPAYAEAVLPMGWRTVLGVPLMVEEECIGGLDVYGDEPKEWDKEELDTAQLMADMATSYIVHAKSLRESRTLADQLQHALDSRVVIEQAKGVLAARLDIDVQEAFELLRGQARSSNMPLRKVAQQVVDGRGGPLR